MCAVHPRQTKCGVMPPRKLERYQLKHGEDSHDLTCVETIPSTKWVLFSPWYRLSF